LILEILYDYFKKDSQLYNFQDTISNLGYLTARDVPWFDIYRDFKAGWKHYHSFSKLRSQLVQTEIDYLSGNKKALKRKQKLEERIKRHPFYNAFRGGFIQTYSTEVMVQEFDTIAGLQQDINELSNWMTTTSKGERNSVGKALNWWMNFGEKKGFTIDHLIRAAGEKAKTSSNSIGEELISISNRLKSTRDTQDFGRYISEIIGAPTSEVVKVGGSVMVITDALSKYTLAQNLLQKINPKTKKKYTVEEAYIEANTSFVDYRINLPKEIKAASDYGVLLFPSFWMRIQKSIMGLVRYHPFTALSAYAVEDLIGTGGLNIMDSNIIKKAFEGNVAHNPEDLLNLNVVSPIFAWFD
jgi:hypothetical protein